MRIRLLFIHSFTDEDSFLWHLLFRRSPSFTHNSSANKTILKTRMRWDSRHIFIYRREPPEKSKMINWNNIIVALLLSVQCESITLRTVEQVRAGGWGATYIHPSMCKSVLLVLRTEKIDIPSTSFCSPCWKQTVDHPPQQKQFQQPRKNPIPRIQIISCHCAVANNRVELSWGWGWGWPKRKCERGLRNLVIEMANTIYIGICLSYMSYVCTCTSGDQAKRADIPTIIHPVHHHHRHLASKARQHNILL